MITFKKCFYTFPGNSLHLLEPCRWESKCLHFLFLKKYYFMIFKISVKSQKGKYSPQEKSVCKYSPLTCVDRLGSYWSFFEEDFLVHSSRGHPDRLPELLCHSLSFLLPLLPAPWEPAQVPIRTKGTPLWSWDPSALCRTWCSVPLTLLRSTPGWAVLLMWDWQREATSRSRILGTGVSTGSRKSKQKEKWCCILMKTEKHRCKKAKTIHLYVIFK